MRIVAFILVVLPLLTNSLVAQDESFPNSWSHDLDIQKRRSRFDIDGLKSTFEAAVIVSSGRSELMTPVKLPSSTLRPIDGSGPTPLEGRDKFKRKDVLASLINRSSMIILGRSASKNEIEIDETISRIEATIAIIEVLKGPTLDKEIKVAWTEDIISKLPPLPDLRTLDQKRSEASHPKVVKEYFTADGIWFISKPTEAVALIQSVEWLPNEMLESVSEIIKNSKP